MPEEAKFLVEPSAISPDRLRLHAALHEAGHAVVGTAAGLAVEYIDIRTWEPTTLGVAIGGTAFVGRGNDVSQLIAAGGEPACSALLAGSLAEERLLKAALHNGYDGDVAILQRAMGWTAEFLASASGRSQAEATSLALVQAAKRDVLRWWRAIRAVALELQHVGFATGEEIEQAMIEHPCRQD